jgi:hypothetical protein
MGRMNSALVFGRGTEVYMMAKVDRPPLPRTPFPANVRVADDPLEARMLLYNDTAEAR